MPWRVKRSKIIQKRYFSEDGCHRGASENEELPQADGTRGCAEGENVPGHNSGVRLVLGTIVFRYPGASPRHRKPYWLRGN